MPTASVCKRFLHSQRGHMLASRQLLKPAVPNRDIRGGEREPNRARKRTCEQFSSQTPADLGALTNNGALRPVMPTAWSHASPFTGCGSR